MVTSPNYYGILQNIPQLADICHAHGVPLLVDAAHGAHCKAVGLPSPIEQGADLAAVSTHKTLPAWGQSAILLSSGRIPFDTLLETAPLFGTSSPSYLLLASIDLARAWLEGDGAQAYAQCAARVQALRREIAQVTAFDTLTEEKAPLDPCRLTIRCTNTNVTGQELSAILHEDFAIDAEMADANYLVCICTGADTERDYARLMGALRDQAVLRRFQAASAAAAVSGAGARVLGAKGVVWRQNQPCRWGTAPEKSVRGRLRRIRPACRLYIRESGFGKFTLNFCGTDGILILHPSA